nr:histone-lysine N-methyltransferase PRDM16-like [Peromyscus maniculatus bairdii]
MRSKARARKLAKSDGDVVNNMYEPDPDLLAGQSAEEETEDSILSPIPMGPPSPFPTSEDFTPKEGSPYEAPVYIPEDIPIPPDFELRESSIPGAGLGIWAKRKMEVGERLGPYVVAPRAALKEADFGWEQMLTDTEVSSQESCIKKVGKRHSCLRPSTLSHRPRWDSDVVVPRLQSREAVCEQCIICTQL